MQKETNTATAKVDVTLQSSNDLVFTIIDGKIWKCTPLTQAETLLLLNANKTSIQTKVQKPKKYTCQVCNEPCGKILNMQGNCSCTIHQKCAKGVNGIYLQHCPVCGINFTESIQQSIQTTQENMNRARQAVGGKTVGGKTVGAKKPQNAKANAREKAAQGNVRLPRTNHASQLPSSATPFPATPSVYATPNAPGTQSPGYPHTAYSPTAYPPTASTPVSPAYSQKSSGSLNSLANQLNGDY